MRSKRSDDDQLSDGVEVLQLGTNPLNTDSDGDGLEDGAEVLQGTDPLVAASDDPDSQGGDDETGGGDEEEPDPAPPAAGTTVLGIRNRQFTLNGVPTFLYGITYAAGLEAPCKSVSKSGMGLAALDNPIPVDPRVESRLRLRDINGVPLTPSIERQP